MRTIESIKIEKIAEICHEVNRLYSESIGDTSQPEWNDAPIRQKVSAIDGVMFALDNWFLTPEEMHNNWMKHKKENGWVYGIKKDEIAKTHPCLEEYHKLPYAQKIKDKLFIAIVRVFKIDILER